MKFNINVHTYIKVYTHARIQEIPIFPICPKNRVVQKKLQKKCFLSGQTGRRTTQKYSSEPHKNIKNLE